MEIKNSLSNDVLTRVLNTPTGLCCNGGVTELENDYENCEAKLEEKNFKLTDETIKFNGRTLYRIQCIKDFVVENDSLKNYLEDGGTSDVKAGELGGFVESLNNLGGNAWICDNAKVYDNARVIGSAIIAGNAAIFGNAFISGDAVVYENSEVYGNAEIWGNAVIANNAKIYGEAKISGSSKIYGNASVYGKAAIHGISKIYDFANVHGNIRIDNTYIGAHVVVKGNGTIDDIVIDSVDAKFDNDVYITANADYMCFTNVGSRLDTLTAYRTKHNGVRITIGCFFGDLAEFRKDVANKGKNEAIIKKEYEMIADIIQHRFIDNNTQNYLVRPEGTECLTEEVVHE